MGVSKDAVDYFDTLRFHFRMNAGNILYYQRERWDVNYGNKLRALKKERVRVAMEDILREGK